MMIEVDELKYVGEDVDWVIFLGYKIYRDGRIFNKHGKKLSPHSNKIYKQVDLYYGGHSKRYSVHRLVASFFVPNPYNKKQVNHKDGNKMNNHYTNLEWATNRENTIHAYKNNLNDRSGNVHKRPVYQMDMDGNIINRFESISEASRHVGRDRRAIRCAITGLYNSSGGFKWKHADE